MAGGTKAEEGSQRICGRRWKGRMWTAQAWAQAEGMGASGGAGASREARASGRE